MVNAGWVLLAVEPGGGIGLETVVAWALGLAGAVVGVGALGFVVAGAIRLLDRVESDPDGPLLPSHYSSLANADPSSYPGYCTDCGTVNDADRDVCANCSSRVPTRKHVDPDWDPEQVFGH